MRQSSFVVLLLVLGYLLSGSRGQEEDDGEEPVPMLGHCPTQVSTLTDLNITKDGNFVARSSFIAHYMHAILTPSSKHSVVIIGANEGETSSDFAWGLLTKSRMKKLLVEPIPKLYTKLQENVETTGMKQATLLNVAIGTEDNASLPMYCFNTVQEGEDLFMDPNEDSLVELKRLKVPNWFSQLCSFNKERLYKSQYDTQRFMKHFVENKQLPSVDKAVEYIKAMTIPTMTVRTLLKDFTNGDLSDIAYVQIDTEGFDYHVVMQLPFESEPTFRPCLVVWEYVLLPAQMNRDLTSRFRRLGYMVYRDDQNLAAVRTN